MSNGFNIRYANNKDGKGWQKYPSEVGDSLGGRHDERRVVSQRAGQGGGGPCGKRIGGDSNKLRIGVDSREPFLNKGRKLLEKTAQGRQRWEGVTYVHELGEHRIGGKGDTNG